MGIVGGNPIKLAAQDCGIESAQTIAHSATDHAVRSIKFAVHYIVKPAPNNHAVIQQQRLE